MKLKLQYLVTVFLATSLLFCAGYGKNDKTPENNQGYIQITYQHDANPIIPNLAIKLVDKRYLVLTPK